MLIMWFMEGHSLCQITPPPLTPSILTVYPSILLCLLQVQKRLFEEGFMADVDKSTSDTFKKKIRNSELAHYNFILGIIIISITSLVVIVICYCCLVVGEKEETNGTANVRTRDNQVHGEMPLDKLVACLLRLKKSRANDDAQEFSKET